MHQCTAGCLEQGMVPWWWDGGADLAMLGLGCSRRVSDLTAPWDINPRLTLGEELVSGEMPCAYR